MKHSLVASVFFFLALLFSVVRADGFPAGADLLIEAVRYRVANHTLVHSLSYVTEQTYRVPTRSMEEIEKEAEEEELAVRRDFKDDPNPPPWLDDIRDHVRKRSMQTSVLSRFTVKYKAPNFSRKLLSLTIERECQGPTGWEEEITVLETNIVSTDSSSEGLQWLHQNRTAYVNETQGYTETLLNFGRIQGRAVAPLLFLLFQDTDIEKYEFSETNIAKLKEELKRQSQLGEVEAAKTIGIATYDGDARAYVVESSKNGKVLERYWIDVNRGFVCPLIQYYDINGKLLSEYKSENYFLHERSGLWFPQLYKEMTTSSDGKQEFKEYRIDQSSLDVNFPIADDEFLVEIPAGAEVIDSRKGKDSKRYKAIDNGVLSLGKDGLDLEKMDWLHAVGEFSKMQAMSWWRIAGLIIGILLIILGIYFHYAKKQNV